MKYTSRLPAELNSTVLLRDGAKQLERLPSGDLFLALGTSCYYGVRLLGNGEFEHTAHGVKLGTKITNYIRALSHELSAEIAREQARKEASNVTK